MHRTFPNVALLVTAATYAGFAVWLGIQPAALLEAFGIESSTPSMLTEIRAFYGGIEMAIAVLMLWFWFRGEIRSGLLVGALPLAGSAIGRSVGMVIDGFSSTHAAFGLLEAVGCLVCLAGYRAAINEDSVSRPREL